MANPVSDADRRLANHNRTQRELMPGETAMDRLAFLRGMQKSSWNHTGFTRDANGEITHGAFLPDVPHYRAGSEEQEKLEADWQAKTLDMMSRQTKIEVPTKPFGNCARSA